MKYVKASNVLPEEIIEIIQQYIDGEYIYIPKKENSREAWGTKTNIKEELSKRNSKIFKDYISGEKVDSLSHKYFLSEKSIQRIIAKKRKSI